jgi:hypothetical protein
MTAATKAKRYVVQNPRRIPGGRHILRSGERYWFEGDDFEPPKGCDVARLLRDRLIKEVRDG